MKPSNQHITDRDLDLSKCLQTPLVQLIIVATVTDSEVVVSILDDKRGTSTIRFQRPLIIQLELVLLGIVLYHLGQAVNTCFKSIDVSKLIDELRWNVVVCVACILSRLDTNVWTNEMVTSLINNTHSLRN